MNAFLVSTFYLFVRLDDCEALAEHIRLSCEQHNVRGTVLLASEGINGTLAGPPAGLEQVMVILRADPRMLALTDKQSEAPQQPFKRLKVRIKKEIVKLDYPGIDAATMAGERVSAQRWNELLDDPDVIVIDTRNDYEVQIGSFPGSINPKTEAFSELPTWVDEQAQLAVKPTVAMFCTGGIRCEKSTALLKSKGFENVYHLDGGILKYLETVEPVSNRWQGECFVFDERVSVDSSLRPGTHRLCDGCGVPVEQSLSHCPGCQARETSDTDD